MASLGHGRVSKLTQCRPRGEESSSKQVAFLYLPSLFVSLTQLEGRLQDAEPCNQGLRPERTQFTAPSPPPPPPTSSSRLWLRQRRQSWRICLSLASRSRVLQ